MKGLRARLERLEATRAATGPIVFGMADGSKVTISGDPVRLYRKALLEEHRGVGFSREVQVLKDSVGDIMEPGGGHLLESARALLNSPQEPEEEDWYTERALGVIQ